jgi:outer membrane receptor protein involved in Fe transport
MVMMFAVVGLWGQATGRLTGTVSDPKGALVPGAKVAATQPDTGFRRSVMTDGTGQFQIPDVPIGRYRLEVASPGFGELVMEDLTVTVGATVAVRAELAVATVSERVEVQGEAPAVEARQAAGVLVSGKALVELPINGRDFARFSLLSPGAVSRTAGLSDLAFNGLHPAHNNITMDGMDANRGDQATLSDGFGRGARLLTGSLETMAEFRVQTNNYRAEYGRAAGSTISIATRGGTNEFHGTAFEFFRNNVLDARNYFNISTQDKDQFRYNNFGGNLGGPVRRNQTFFFVNGEFSRQRQGVRGTGTVPSEAMREQALRTSPELGFLLENFPRGTSATANPLVANYSRFQSLEVNEETGSARIDHAFSEATRIYGRVNLNNGTVDGPLFSILPSALGVTDFQTVPTRTRNAVLNLQHTVSPRTIVELRAGLQRTATNGSSETPYPQVSITGLTVVPGSRRLNLSNANVFQYSGSVTSVRGAHTVKAGAGLWRTQVNSWTTSVVSLAYLSPADFIANRMQLATLTAGTFGNGIRQTHTGAFLQDTWQARPGLTVDIGLRYDYTAPNRDAQDRLLPFDTRTGQLKAPGEPWYNADRNNFAPRVGVAWQVRRGVALRTGYGIFFQQFPAGIGNSLPQNTLAGNAQLVRQSIPDLAWPLDRFVNRGVAPAPVANGIHYDKPDLYAQQWNVTVLTELPGGFGLETGYVGNRGVNLRRQVNVNWLNPATNTRLFPRYSRVNIDYANGQSSYHALQAALRRRFGRRLDTAVNYTYGKAIDNVPDAVVGATEPQDPFCLALRAGPWGDGHPAQPDVERDVGPAGAGNCRGLEGGGAGAVPDRVPVERDAGDQLGGERQSDESAAGPGGGGAGVCGESVAGDVAESGGVRGGAARAVWDVGAEPADGSRVPSGGCVGDEGLRAAGATADAVAGGVFQCAEPAELRAAECGGGDAELRADL